jgi:UDP:flavonoid glycosyltransferase YjiC (YdhE family)
MTRFILASTPLQGHVRPLLVVSDHLCRHGHEVVFTTGRRFEEAVKETGARFVPLAVEADFDHLRLDESFPERAHLSPLGQAVFDLEHLYADRVPAQYAGLREILRRFPAKVILTDIAFEGTWPLALHKSEQRVAIAALGNAPVILPSQDTAPPGLGLLPDSSPEGRERNRAANAQVSTEVFGQAQAYTEAVFRELGLTLPHYVFDAFYRVPDRVLQLTTPSFEYPRSDAPAGLRCVGPLPANTTSDFTPPSWWSDLNGTRPVVLVTQGTMANDELGKLVAPTLAALAHRDVLVVATAGGADLSRLPGEIPDNARVEQFLPFDKILPEVDVYVTNGGYGGVNQALSHGIPLVVAGATEDKPEVAARVEWSGVGINLGTGEPTVEQVRDAVERVLADPSYRKRAVELQNEFAEHNALEEITAVLSELAGRGESWPTPGAERA